MASRMSEQKMNTHRKTQKWDFIKSVYACGDAKGWRAPKYMNSNCNTCFTDVLTAWMLEEEGSENVMFLDGH